MKLAPNSIRMPANAKARSSLLPSKQSPFRLWCRPHSFFRTQPHPLLPASFLNDYHPTRKLKGIFHPSATSFPTLAPPCQQLAYKPGRGKSRRTPCLHKHIWKFAGTKGVCAWRLPSKTAVYHWIFMRPTRVEENTN